MFGGLRLEIADIDFVLLENPYTSCLIDTGRKVLGYLNALLPQVVLRIGNHLIRVGRIDEVGTQLQPQPQPMEIVFLNVGDNVFEGRGTFIEQRALGRKLGVCEETVGCSYPYNALRVFVYRMDIIASSADMLIVMLLLC